MRQYLVLALMLVAEAAALFVPDALLYTLRAAGQEKATPAVLFPDATAVAPASTAAVKLSSGQLYVFRSTAPAIVLTSPEGLLRVTQPGVTKPAQYVAGDGAYEIKAEVAVKIASPLELKARFADGDGSVQAKTYTEKHVWCIEAVGTGTVELLVIVDGGKEIFRRTIDANHGPRPPDPDPVPIPPSDPLAIAFAKAWAAETPADKAKVRELATLYRMSVKTADDATIPTAFGLHVIIKAARVSLIGESLPNVRAVITAELNKVLPTAVGAQLTPEVRVTAKAAFTRIATALEGLK